LFIAEKYNIVAVPLAGMWRALGDDRPGPSWSTGSSVNCVDARGCVKVDLSSRAISVRVNPTCAQSNVRRSPGPAVWGDVKCTSAFGFTSNGCSLDRCNIVSVFERAGGVITLRWDVTQSHMPIFRTANTVNGKMVIHPGSGSSGPYVEFWGRGSARRRSTTTLSTAAA
jgi:hypothetical protein